MVQKQIDAHQTARAHGGTLYETATPDDMHIRCYAQCIPQFAEVELERLYASFYSSLPQLEIEGDARGVSTYVVRRGSEIVELWLYRVHGQEVRVLNEAIPVTADAVHRFASTMFGAHPGARRVVFNAVFPRLDKLRLPFLRFHCSDDSVLVLPDSEEAYLAMLGKATRKNIKRYVQRFEQTFPSFRYDVYEREAIPEPLLRAIVGLNRTRMSAKGKVSGIDRRQEEHMLLLARRTGLIAVATIDGEVCAGAIVYQVGPNYFSFVRAHDPAYNDYRLGLIGAYRLVRHCIERGGRELHFMWGREPHKALLGGRSHELEQVIVFRSRLHALRDGNLILKNVALGVVRKSKLRLLEKARNGDDGWARLLQRVLKTLRGQAAE